VQVNWICWPVILNVLNCGTAIICAVYAWRLWRMTRIRATLFLTWGFIVGAVLRGVLIVYDKFPMLQLFIVTWILLTFGMAGLYHAVAKIWDKPEGTR
jgi:uncharacterized membrane protein YoaK (UPF0700 family)